MDERNAHKTPERVWVRQSLAIDFSIQFRRCNQHMIRTIKRGETATGKCVCRQHPPAPSSKCFWGVVWLLAANLVWWRSVIKSN